MVMPKKFESVEQLEVLIDKYFESCFGVDDKGNRIQIRPITLEGLAYDIGCDRRTIWNYKQKPEFFPIIERAIIRCNVAMAEYALTAKNPAGAIWLACNNHGYTQKSEVTVTAQPEQLSTEDIKRQLMERNKTMDDG